VSEKSAAKPKGPRDALTAALLFLVLAAIFALTQSRRLDDWDSVNFALALDSFDVPKRQPHPPGYPIYVTAGKLVQLVITDNAAAVTLVSSLSGAAVAAMFFLLLRRSVDWAIALDGTVATVLAAVGPRAHRHARHAVRRRVPAGRGYPASTPDGDRLRRIACGVIVRAIQLDASPDGGPIVPRRKRCLAGAGRARHRRVRHLRLSLPRAIPIPPRQARGVGARRTRQPVLYHRARGRADSGDPQSKRWPWPCCSRLAWCRPCS
jgi:hypothetical protein